MSKVRKTALGVRHGARHWLPARSRSVAWLVVTAAIAGVVVLKAGTTISK